MAYAVQVGKSIYRLSATPTYSIFCSVVPQHRITAASAIGLDRMGTQNNGGPSQTIALLTTSSAIDLTPLPLVLSPQRTMRAQPCWRPPSKFTHGSIRAWPRTPSL